VISALDSSVILDVLTADDRFADASEVLIRRARGEGKLVVCECVVAEVRPALASDDAMRRLMEEWQLYFVPSSEASSVLAGRLFARHLGRGGKPGRVVPDFLIGAHAQLHADRLLARDRG
jgi:predicted nucleic acid-binding protein